MSQAFEIWPPQASHHAREVDLLIGSFGAMVWLLTLPVFVLMAWFAIRYRRGRQIDRTHAPSKGLWLELSWSIVPFALTLFFYVWATMLFLKLHRPPADALGIDVVAKQWMWKFQHQEGAREINRLHVPMGEPVRLTMTSEDVIHSLYLPALRIKQDVLPGRTTTLWFNADRPGTYALRCAEFCGMDHSVMGGSLVVMRREDYAKWLRAARDGGTDATQAGQGRTLYAQLGCGGCHGAGAAVRAPALSGLYGRPVAIEGGGPVVADEQYLRDSLLLPNKQVVAGFAPVMPTYASLLAPEQVNALVAYLKALP